MRCKLSLTSIRTFDEASHVLERDQATADARPNHDLNRPPPSTMSVRSLTCSAPKGPLRYSHAFRGHGVQFYAEANSHGSSAFLPLELEYRLDAENPHVGP